MSDEVPAIARKPSRLASVFDDFPPDVPLSLDDLELAMSRDLERRCLAALDRALVRLSEVGSRLSGEDFVDGAMPQRPLAPPRSRDCS